MREIRLTQGKVALVDDDDFEALNKFKWYASKDKNTHYADRHSTYVDGKRKTIRMHCEIIGALSGLVTDHIDGNGLNNQKSNLRIVTIRQNCQNKKGIIKSSEYPGVRWRNNRNKWEAGIKLSGKDKFLGHFISETEAFDAYRKAVETIGESVIAA
jgi:hypothetical protein